MKSITRLTRRSALKGAAALAGAGAFGLSRPSWAQANKRVVLSTWGGDYSDLLTKNISKPLMTPKGWEVVNDDANAPQRIAKVIAEKRLPRGSSDIQALAATDIGQLIEADLLDKLDASKMPNAKNVLKTFSIADSPYFSPHIYSGMVVLYNPKMIPTAPTGLADLWDAKHTGKVGIVDIQHNYVTLSAALAGGAKNGDFDRAKKMLLDLKKVKPIIYPTNEALAQGLKTEECAISIMWKARAVQWQNAGANILTVAPKEGILTYVSGFTMPKNAPNKDGAYAFLNAALETPAQQGFAVDMGYNPVVGNAPITDDLRRRIGFTKQEEELLVNPDLDVVTKKQSEIKDFWDKEFKA